MAKCVALVYSLRTINHITLSLSLHKSLHTWFARITFNSMKSAVIIFMRNSAASFASSADTIVYARDGQPQ